MFQKFIILLLVATLSSAQDDGIIRCDLQIINNRCECSTTIYNPNNFDDYIVHGNPGGNCILDDVVDVAIVGHSTNIPRAICQTFPKLQKIVARDIYVNNLGNNPFYNCRNLTDLDISSNIISTILPYIFQNTQLEKLNLSSNNLKNASDATFYNLEHLRYLYLDYNPGVELAANSFQNLRSLYILSMSYCQLTEIKSSWFQDLVSLNELNLARNKITFIPSAAFSYLRSLEWLYLSYNQIDTITVTTFRNNTNLLYLYLNNNKLTALPSSLFAYQQRLNSLYLSANSLSQIPLDVFKSLTSLRVLYLEGCTIDELHPEWFSTMRSLVLIDLRNNNIDSIPHRTFTAPSNMETLYLSNNNISRLDSRSFGSLRNLHILRTPNNRINEIDFHFLNQSTVHTIADFLSNVCVNLHTDNFVGNKENIVEQMKGCFDNFDKNEIHLETFNSSIYDWHNIRPEHGWLAINVTVKAAENVHIGLIDSLESENPKIEIFLGQDEDHQSEIWEQQEKVFNNRVRNRLSETEARTFLISWDQQIVLVFRHGDQFPFMLHKIINEFPVNFFGIRTLIDPENSQNKAVWTVTRIHGNPPIQAKRIYDDIEKKMKLKMPIDLESYLQRN